jgi:hypothetical protein
MQCSIKNKMRHKKKYRVSQKRKFKHDMYRVSHHLCPVGK